MTLLIKRTAFCICSLQVVLLTLTANIGANVIGETSENLVIAKENSKIKEIENVLELHDGRLRGISEQLEELQRSISTFTMGGRNFINLYYESKDPAVYTDDVRRKNGDKTNEQSCKESQLKASKIQDRIILTKLCVAEIQSGHTSDAQETYEKILHTFDTSENEEKFLKSIIKNAYDCDVRNVVNILQFCDLFNRYQQADILWALYEEMVNHKQLDSHQVFQVAYKVKQLITKEQDSKSTAAPTVITKLFGIKSKLPPAIRSVIFENTNLCVKTKYFGNEEYLFAQSDDITYDSERRYVFTNRDNKLSVGLQKVWIFEPAQGARYFSIKSKVYEEYLYAAANDLSYDHFRRRLFTWKPKTDFETSEWELTPIRKGTAVYLKQRFYNEYVYPLAGNEYDTKRRQVFSWRDPREEGENSKQYNWLVEPCP